MDWKSPWWSQNSTLACEENCGLNIPMMVAKFNPGVVHGMFNTSRLKFPTMVAKFNLRDGLRWKFVACVENIGLNIPVMVAKFNPYVAKIHPWIGLRLRVRISYYTHFEPKYVVSLYSQWHGAIGCMSFTYIVSLDESTRYFKQREKMGKKWRFYGKCVS